MSAEASVPADSTPARAGALNKNETTDHTENARITDSAPAVKRIGLSCASNSGSWGVCVLCRYMSAAAGRIRILTPWKGLFSRVGAKLEQVQQTCSGGGEDVFLHLSHEGGMHRAFNALANYLSFNLSGAQGRIHAL